ncbi:cytochrome P450 704C1-like [Macadamia integrifolia]|uniref:cytochrome P450 704C1-like n=1 Tax=Macadamia integrifolia TaxID=60698 RepID=UPI001C4E56D5|nr:cytochrome P450 704C1-like [Macadamia integrifolia]
MQYLYAALPETLGLYPAVVVDAKICLLGDALPDGYIVKKGDMVAYQPYVMGKMKFIWGEDAREFWPERWFNEDGVFQQESPSQFTAFQGGPRICLGKELTYRQMRIFAALAVTLAILIFKIFAAKEKRYRPVVTELAAKYGTYRLLSPFRSEVYTADPANVEYILKTNFPNYGKGWHNYSILSDLLGDGIFTVDCKKWRHQRKVSTYEFSAKVLRDVSSIVFKRNAVKLARILSETSTTNEAFDILDLFMKSTLDSIFKVGFGVELDSMPGSTEGTKFPNAFDDSSALTLWRYVDILWPIKKFLNIGSEAALRKNIKVIDSFMYKLISQRIEQNKNSPGDASGEGLVTHLIQSIVVLNIVFAIYHIFMEGPFLLNIGKCCILNRL